MQDLKNGDARPRVPTLGRRDLMKLSAGAVVTTLTGSMVQAESAPPEAPVPSTHAGWKNTAHRISGNGPMDETSRQIVEYTTAFSESHLTDAALHALSRIMVDSMASLVTGFESESARICARMARSIQSTQ